MADDINYMDPKEFLDEGFLQEANRQFFHPLGLALEVYENEDGTVTLSGIWDYRDDPEGMIFERWSDQSVIKAEHVENERRRHNAARVALGLPTSGVQPVGFVPKKGSGA